MLKNSKELKAWQNLNPLKGVDRIFQEKVWCDHD
jgi:hypothetical protein